MYQKICAFLFAWFVSVSCFANPIITAPVVLAPGVVLEQLDYVFRFGRIFKYRKYTVTGVIKIVHDRIPFDFSMYDYGDGLGGGQSLADAGYDLALFAHTAAHGTVVGSLQDELNFEISHANHPVGGAKFKVLP